jgi:hypothetical protein
LILKRRVSGFEKEKRDVLIYWVCKAGWFTNERVGTFFGLTRFAVSHSFLEIKKTAKR